MREDSPGGSLYKPLPEETDFLRHTPCRYDFKFGFKSLQDDNHNIWLRRTRMKNCGAQTFLTRADATRVVLWTVFWHLWTVSCEVIRIGYLKHDCQTMSYTQSPVYLATDAILLFADSLAGDGRLIVYCLDAYITWEGMNTPVEKITSDTDSIPGQRSC